MKLFRIARAISLICAAALPALSQAPTWDSSGNGQLNGSYYFREVNYVVGDNSGSLSRAVSLYGSMSFDGNGNFTIAGAQVFDSGVGRAQTFAASGTYSIAASGYGFFSNPLSAITGGSYTVSGLVSNGIFVGSDTGDGFNNLFIAAPIASPAATVSSFHGSYSVSAFIPVIGQSGNNADASFQLNPDGAGNLGTININGYFGGGGTKVYAQSTAAVKYFYSNGAGVITFPTSSSANFYVGQEYVYMSPDGNFIFGGSPQDFDFFVGVRTPAANATQNFSGLYYEAGIDEDATQLASAGFSDLDTFYGSFNATGGNIVGHERLEDVFNTGPEGFTYAATYPSSLTGTYNSSSGSTQYTVGNNGTIRIGFGVGPTLSMSVALQATPILSGSSSVFLNPAGVANAASAAPFTAGISGGEFITLYGSNLAPGTKVAGSLPFPTNLNGVQVSINGLAAPLYYVSPTQISAIVPYGITYSIGQIQVTNNGVASNSITEVVNKTTPGIFTLSSNGLGYGAIEHADGTVVTASHPAVPGEGVAVYMSGLGAVFPPIPEGTPGPSATLSKTTNTFTAFVGANSATVTYAGLAPYLAGLYQVNLTIPSGATSGDNVVSIQGPDSYNSQALIPIGTGSGLTPSSAGVAVSSATSRARRLTR